MALVLATVRCPDYAAPERRRVEGGDYLIGRGADCDWTLPSPERVLSKRHCVLEFRAGSWRVCDLSANGTYLNHAADPIGRGQGAALNDGDRLRLGPYEVEVRVEVAVEEGRGWHAPLPGIGVGAGPEPLAPDAEAEDDLPGRPAVPDHRPATGDAFLPPLPRRPPDLLPEDWDTDLPPPGRIPSTPVFPSTPVRGSVTPQRTLPRPFNDAPLGAARALAPAPGAKDRDADLGPFAEPPAAWTTAAPGAPPSTEPAPPAPPVAAVPAPGPALAAFLAGAGLAPAAGPAAGPDTALRALGAAFRAAVSGLRGLLIARAGVKREFRIEQTMLRAANNNPVKFAATDEAAVAALVAAGEDGERAVAETVADLEAHQVATLAATQAAARALLERLAPAVLEAEAAGNGGGGLFGAREKRLWEAYRRLHAQVAAQFEDDFDSAFGKAFARAYEQAVAARPRGGAG